MKKIPFEATFVGAYKFLFTRILSIIGTVWLPTLVFGALSAGLLYLTIPQGWWHGQFPVLAEKNPDPWAVWAVVKPFLIAGFPIFLMLIVMSAMTTVGLMQLALGQKKRCFVYFSLGADVWRMIGSWVLVMLVFWLIYILMIVAFIVGTMVLKPHVSEAAGILLLVLAGISCFVFIIYAMVRISFFLEAVVVAEHQVNLTRSWELGKGNFWRMVGLMLLTYIPVAVVAQVIQQVLITLPMAAGILQFSEHPPASPLVVFQAMWPAVGGLLAVFVLQNIALQGLFAALTAQSYQAVTAQDEVAP